MSNEFVIGGTDPNKPPEPVVTPEPAVPQDAVSKGLIVAKGVAGAHDSYTGGLQVLRDATHVVGGTYGYVNTANFTRTTAGPENVSFEWASLAIMDNFAKAGENVAFYAQGNKFAEGPTWAAVSQTSDPEGKPGPTISHEVDLWTVGPDNGQRVGFMVVLGESKHPRTENPKRGWIGGSTAVQVEAQPGTVWTRGIKLIGDFLVGLDFAFCELKTAIRLKRGQAIAFDEYDSHQLSYSDGRMRFTAHGRPVFEIDMHTGDTYKMGVKQS